ncbi:MAG TPA: choice-of-anchor tandem repeat GloVer-containing protein [Rhizomicrobium sp.]|nr:choice-of-anchor tandem repeat GloVer-containing protein [Rhizomicrobium sp.]
MRLNLTSAMVLGAALVVCATTLPALAYTETTLHTFCPVTPKKPCRSGSAPTGLAIDQSGNLFGVTAVGGKYNAPYGAGVVFEFSPSTEQYSVLWNFCKKTGCADGWEPGRVNLVIDAQGNLYGTTTKGGLGSEGGNGVVFELFHKNGIWQEKTLYEFCSLKNCTDGGDPRSGLTYAAAASGQAYDGVSPLYGTTYYGGGSTSEGAVFSLTPNTGTKKWSEQVLYSFCSLANCTDGQNPAAPLYIDDLGNIYGSASGGSTNDGVIFELSPKGSGYTQSLPYTFCQQINCTDGAGPQGGVIMGTSDNLYGTTVAGGSGQGVVFELSPNGSEWQYSDLEVFDGTDGIYPSGGLIMDANGNLFGTTYAGGPRQHGNVFEFNGSIQSLYDFCPERKCRDGKGPVAGVVEDGAGNLYGVAQEGGFQDSGTLFELSP